MMPLRPDTIWQFAQNKPSLVASDLEKLGVPRAVTHRVLLARGVYKWLAARRQIIALKDAWRDEVNRTLAAIRDAKARRDRDALMYHRGYLKARRSAAPRCGRCATARAGKRRTTTARPWRFSKAARRPPSPSWGTKRNPTTCRCR